MRFRSGHQSLPSEPGARRLPWDFRLAVPEFLAGECLEYGLGPPFPDSARRSQPCPAPPTASGPCHPERPPPEATRPFPPGPCFAGPRPKAAAVDPVPRHGPARTRFPASPPNPKRTSTEGSGSEEPCPSADSSGPMTAPCSAVPGPASDTAARPGPLGTRSGLPGTPRSGLRTWRVSRRHAVTGTLMFRREGMRDNRQTGYLDRFLCKTRDTDHNRSTGFPQMPACPPLTGTWPAAQFPEIQGVAPGPEIDEPGQRV